MRSAQEFLFYLVAGLALRIISEELAGLTLRLSRRLVKNAAAEVSHRRRKERLRDWRAEIEARGPVSCLSFAVSIWFSYRGAPQLRRVLLESALSSQFAVKRGLDLIFASLLVAFLAPTFLMVALALAIDSPGPILVRWIRVGRAGREFSLLHFRTLPWHAPQSGAAKTALGTGATDEHERQEPLRASSPTPMGRLVRRYALDVLPELLNIVRGDLSFVGPRPEPTYMQREVSEAWFRYKRVRPGMTGPCQVQSASNCSWEQKAELDLHYAQNWSLALDARIILASLREVFLLRLTTSR